MYSIFFRCLLIFQLPQFYLTEQFILQGKCIGYDGSFCDSIFTNSICDPVKNECVCPDGFVVVENNGHAICTSLLTDLRCIIDKDCIHVDLSICHPGTGRCICGSDSVYVPTVNGCRKTASIEDSSLCLYCQRLRGVCYLERSVIKEKISSRSQHSSTQVGCRCPHHPIRHISGIYHSISFCQIHLVDQGERCDMKSHICRSKRALCSKAENTEFNFLCKCPQTHVVVYQAQLEYYECYPQLESKSPQCETCISNGGICYDNNNDKVGDGCICLPRFSTISNHDEKEFTDQKTFCNIDHITAMCNDEKLVVCYTPHQNPPYSKLRNRLSTGKSTVYLVNANFTTKTRCQIIKTNPNDSYCITVDIVKNPCDLTTVFHEGNVTIEGLVFVVLNRDRINSENNIKMPFNCTSKFDESKQHIIKSNDELQFIKTHPISVSMNILNHGNKTRKISNFLNVSLEIVVRNINNQVTENSNEIFKNRILKAFSCSMDADVKQKQSLSIFLIKEGCPDFFLSLDFSMDNFLIFQMKIKPKYLQTLLNYKTNYFSIKCTFYICKETMEKSCTNINANSFENNNCLFSYPIQSYTYFKVDVPQASNNPYPVKSLLFSSESHLFTIIILSLMIIILVAIFSLVGVKCCGYLKRFLIGPPSYSSSTQFIKVSPDRYFNIISKE